MYAYIKGTVTGLGSDSVVLDNNGIGYRISVPGTLIDELSIGDERKLYTYFSVREDAMQLFGFLREDDLEVFRLLLGVSGIGPKGALGVLGVMDADDLRLAVLSDDVAAIAKAPGIGKKTAQKVILELRDKLDLEDALTKKSEHAAEKGDRPAKDSPQSEAVQALAALGYSASEAYRAVKTAADREGAEDVEALIRAALKEMI